MKLEKGYWIDENGNSWDSEKYSEKESKRLSESLVNCYNCLDCYFCENCVNCKHCFNCYFCKNCVNCKHCFNCVNCTNYYDYKDCIKCENVNFVKER